MSSLSTSGVGQAYVKAVPMREMEDVNGIKAEIQNGNILIVKITALAKKNVDETKRAINELCNFVRGLDGDIARLGEERIVITPPGIKIWREKETLAVASSGRKHS